MSFEVGLRWVVYISEGQLVLGIEFILIFVKFAGNIRLLSRVLSCFKSLYDSIRST